MIRNWSEVCRTNDRCDWYRSFVVIFSKCSTPGSRKFAGKLNSSSNKSKKNALWVREVARAQDALWVALGTPFCLCVWSCARACVHVCMHCVRVCLCVVVCACVFLHLYVFVCVHACVWGRGVRGGKFTWVHACVHPFVHAFGSVRACMRAYV